MNTSRGGGEVLRRLAAWGIYCSLVAAALWLDLATASHPSHRHTQDGDESLELRAAKGETAVASFLKNTHGEVSQGSQDGGQLSEELEAEVAGRIRDVDVPPSPSSDMGFREEHYHSRIPRSPQQPGEEHLTCLVNSSCSVRYNESYSEEASMYPCMCDDECYLYGDCCHDHPSVNLPPPALRPACRPLTPIVAQHYTFHRTVFLVTQCPEGTPFQLADRCLGKGFPNYLKDIPVFSRTSSVGYSNIFCAMCHNDTDIQNFEMSISCIGTVNSTTELEDMTYHAGELQWSSPGNASEGTEISCLLHVAFPPSLGRWCQDRLMNTCRKDWPVEKHVRRCAAYNYYVQAGSYVYKNSDCALCNGVPQEDIQCLSLFRVGADTWFPPPPSLTELFEVHGDCKEDEVWDVLYRRCEHVSCGFLFALVDGKCVRSNKTIPKDGESYLNTSCYVAEFRQNLSTAFPNHSIYINETQRLYHFGEYEFHESWIRVCDEKERWTPVMHIISSVLILISLVCLVLHMIIFMALPKRRNIHSKNLFSMTVSLFMAEFMFLTFFQLRLNYVTCVVSGVTMYYFLCVSFLWMNVMSIDIFRTFYSGTHRTKSQKIFVMYSLYAWLLPIGGVLVAVVVDQFWPDFMFAPHFGTDTCWLNNKWGLVAFFTFPSGMIIMANLVLYMVSVQNIYSQMKSGEIASSTVRKTDGSSKYKGQYSKEKPSMDPSNTGRKVSAVHSEKSSPGVDSLGGRERPRDKPNKGFHSAKKHRTRLILYCKLALIMGMTWIFAFISMHTKSIVFEYLFIVFNGLQGTFIFVSFDLKKKIWEELFSKYGCRGIQRRGTFRVKANIKSCSVRTTSDGEYSYKPHRRPSHQSEGWRGQPASFQASKTQPSQETAESEV